MMLVRLVQRVWRWKLGRQPEIYEIRHKKPGGRISPAHPVDEMENYFSSVSLAAFQPEMPAERCFTLV